MKLNYVFSGCSMWKINHDKIYSEGEEKLLSDVQNIFKTFNEYFPKNPVGVLYNGFTEKQHSTVLPKLGVDTYVDSGGLQIITLGKQKLDDELKKKIYTVQTTGDYAMCFDEIPLYIDESKVGAGARTDMGGKYLIGEEVYDKGVATGRNIKNQIETFKELNAHTKVFIILQGNSYEDWMNFSDGVFSQLDFEEDNDYVAGLAIADTCLGNGILEAIDMYSVIPDLKCPESWKLRLHLLGVGSFNRLVPILAMIKSGYLSNKTQISYDSSSHSSAIMFGRYLSKGMKTYDFNKLEEGVVCDRATLIVDHIWEVVDELGWEKYIGMTKQEFNDKFHQMTYTSFKSMYINEECDIQESKDFRQSIMIYIVVTLSQIFHFNKNILKHMESEETFRKYLTSNSNTKILVTLLKIKTYDELKVWRDNVVRAGIGSNRVSRVDTKAQYEAKINAKPAVDEWM